MTGYARVSGDWNGLGWVWEVKSVNGRGLELRTKLPAGFDQLDLPVRDAVHQRFKRGTIALSLSLAGRTAAGPLSVNDAWLSQLVALAQSWQARAPHLAPARFDGLLALKGVLEAPDGAESIALDAALAAHLQQQCQLLLDQLAGMRGDEGRQLAAVLNRLLGAIDGLVEDARAVLAQDPDRLKARLRQQVAALLEAGAPLSEDRLAMEVALIIGKADVREEIDRLTAHLSAARTLLAEPEPVGRKLDFLCQEFNREANTLCSKAGDLELSRIGLALKATIEQFREQVQNIE
jgi:uncharacterized protein (TIGR00255 family)